MVNKRVLEHQTPPDEVASVEIIDGEYSIEEELTNIESEAGEDTDRYIVRVWRIPEKGERRFLFMCAPGQFSMDALRDKYGSGKYDIWVYRGNRIARRWNGREIEAPANWEPPSKPSEEKKQESSHIVVQAIQQLGEMMFKQNEMLQNRISQIQAQAPTHSPAPQLDQSQIMTSMLTAMLQMKQLLAPASEGNSISQAIEMFGKGVELAKELGGGGDDTNIWAVLKDVVGTFGKPIAEAALHLDKMQTQPQITDASGRVISIIRPPQPAAHVAGNASGGNVPGNPNMQQMMLKAQLDFLIKQARRNGDPELYANLILDNVPEQAVREFIVREDALQKMSALNPEVAQHAVWFTELRNVLTELLAEGDNVSQDASGSATGDPSRHSERPAGDTGDPSGNAGDGE